MRQHTERERRIFRKCLTLIFFIKSCVIGMQTVVSTLAGIIGTQLTRNKQYWRSEGISHYPWSSVCNCEHWCRSFFFSFFSRRRFSALEPVHVRCQKEKLSFPSFTCSNCQSFPGKCEKLSRPIWLSRMLRWGTQRETEKASKYHGYINLSIDLVEND